MKTYFKAGQDVEIYQRPLSNEEFEGVAQLVSCLRPYTEFFYEGLIVEEWMVRFGQEEESFLRIVTRRVP